MSFPTSAVVDSGAGTDANSPLAGWTTIQALFDGGYRSAAVNTGIARATNKFKAQVAGWQLSYRTAESPGADCEVYATIDTLPLDGDEVILHARMGGGLDSTWDGYKLIWGQGTGTSFLLKLQRIVGGNPVAISQISLSGAAVGQKFGLECIGTAIKAYWFNGTSWVEELSAVDSNIVLAGKMGLEIRNTTGRFSNFGGGSVATVTLDDCLPDADVTTTGWSTAPLFSKVNDASDATVITATAA